MAKAGLVQQAGLPTNLSQQQFLEAVMIAAAIPTICVGLLDYLAELDTSVTTHDHLSLFTIADSQAPHGEIPDSNSNINTKILTLKTYP